MSGIYIWFYNTKNKRCHVITKHTSLTILYVFLSLNDDSKRACLSAVLCTSILSLRFVALDVNRIVCAV